MEQIREWDEFWKDQRAARSFAHKIILWGRSRFARIYVRFAKQFFSGGAVLDAGCGSAEPTLILAKKIRYTGHIVGIDFSVQSIAHANENAKRQHVQIDLVLADVRYIPFVSNYFDLVWNMGVLEHVEDSTPILQEMKRVAKEGGTMIAILPFRYTPLILVGTFFNALQKISRKFYVRTWESKAWFRSGRDLEEIFERVGLKRAKAHILLDSFMFDIAVVGTK